MYENVFWEFDNIEKKSILLYNDGNLNIYKYYVI